MHYCGTLVNICICMCDLPHELSPPKSDPNPRATASSFFFFLVLIPEHHTLKPHPPEMALSHQVTTNGHPYLFSHYHTPTLRIRRRLEVHKHGYSSTMDSPKRKARREERQGGAGDQNFLLPRQQRTWPRRSATKTAQPPVAKLMWIFWV